MKKEDLLNASKQELIQADSKLGWLAAIYILFIGVIITIGIHVNKWEVIGPVLALPISSILIIAYGLIPQNITGPKNQEYNSYSYSAKTSQITSNKSIVKFDEKDNSYKTLIAVNYQLSKKKYLCATISAWYILFLFWIYKLIKK